MKRSVLITFFLLMTGGFAMSQSKINWLTFEEAAAKTQEKPRMVFVDVYTDWCGWCKKMDKETFTDPKVIAYINENFYPVKMNAENTTRKFTFRGREYTEATMAATMRIRSYPNFVIMDSAMENITQYPGYRQAEPFLTGLTGILEKFGK